MDDLIKEALIEEAAAAPFPANAWQRQEALLSEAGLFGAQVDPPRQRRVPGTALLQLASLAALLLLAFGIGSLRPWRFEAPAPAAPPSTVELATPGDEAPSPPSIMNWIDAIGSFQLPPTDQFASISIRSSTLGPLSAEDSGAEQILAMLRQWLASGQIIGIEPFWSPVPHQESITLRLKDGHFLTIQANDSCYGPYNPPACYTIVRLPDGKAVRIVQEDLSRWLDGKMWEQRRPWLANALKEELTYRFTPAEATDLVIKSLAHTGKEERKATSTVQVQELYLRIDREGAYHVELYPAWTLTFPEWEGVPREGEWQLQVTFMEADAERRGPPVPLRSTLSPLHLPFRSSP